jgi:hypothetical protein
MSFIKNWIISYLLEAAKELLESGQIAEWLDAAKGQAIVWIEPKLRELAKQSDNSLDDALVDIILEFLKK